MLESEAKRVREQKVREAEGLYEELRDYIIHDCPNAIESAGKSAANHRINDICDRLGKALNSLKN